jgi:CheY-like chemotaxis protein
LRIIDLGSFVGPGTAHCRHRQESLRAAILEEGLRAAGHISVVHIDDTADLLDRIQAIDPDVILIDLESPSRDVLEQMFKMSRSVARPIAMFVDRSYAGMIDAAIDAGVSAISLFADVSSRSSKPLIPLYVCSNSVCYCVPPYATIQHLSRDRNGVEGAHGAASGEADKAWQAQGWRRALSPGDGGPRWERQRMQVMGAALHKPRDVTRKERAMGLGSYPQVSLAEARKFRDKALALVRGGLDPIEERERQKAGASAATPSFNNCAGLYIAAHEPSWRNAKHKQQWANTLRDYASPVFGSMPVEEITTERVLEVLTPLWLKKPRRHPACARELSACSPGQPCMDTAKARIRHAGEIISISCYRHRPKCAA